MGSFLVYLQDMNIPYDTPSSLKFTCELAEFAIDNCTIWLTFRALEQGTIISSSP